MSKKLNKEELLAKVSKKLDAKSNPFHVISDCLVVYNQIDITSFSALAKLFPKDAVIGMPAQANARATFVIGVEEDIKAMRETEEFQELCKREWAIYVDKVAGQKDYNSIPEDIRNWFETGHIGASSFTLLNVTLGKKYGFYDEHDHTDDYPLDIHDLERCIKLVKAVPELQNYLPRIARLSPYWAYAVENWDHYTSQLEKVDNKELDKKDVADEYRAGRPKGPGLKP